MSRCSAATPRASADARARMNESPLGAAALAGSPFPIDRQLTAKALGFDRPTANSLDSVSARDFALEALAAASHRRHAPVAAGRGDRASGSTPQFGFIKLTDAFTTGSLDHAAEAQSRTPPSWCRAKVGRILGSLTSLTGGDEGPAARLFEGHAGGQGADLRGLRRARPVAGGHGRHGPRPRARWPNG